MAVIYIQHETIDLLKLYYAGFSKVHRPTDQVV